MNLLLEAQLRKHASAADIDRYLDDMKGIGEANQRVLGLDAVQRLNGNGTLRDQGQTMQAWSPSPKGLLDIRGLQSPAIQFFQHLAKEAEDGRLTTDDVRALADSSVMDAYFAFRTSDDAPAKGQGSAAERKAKGLGEAPPPFTRHLEAHSAFDHQRQIHLVVAGGAGVALASKVAPWRTDTPARATKEYHDWPTIEALSLTLENMALLWWVLLSATLLPLKMLLELRCDQVGYDRRRRRAYLSLPPLPGVDVPHIIPLWHGSHVLLAHVEAMRRQGKGDGLFLLNGPRPWTYKEVKRMVRQWGVDAGIPNLVPTDLQAAYEASLSGRKEDLTCLVRHLSYQVKLRGAIEKRADALAAGFQQPRFGRTTRAPVPGATRCPLCGKALDPVRTGRCRCGYVIPAQLTEAQVVEGELIAMFRTFLAKTGLTREHAASAVLRYRAAGGQEDA